MALGGGGVVGDGSMVVGGGGGGVSGGAGGLLMPGASPALSAPSGAGSGASAGGGLIVLRPGMMIGGGGGEQDGEAGFVFADPLQQKKHEKGLCVPCKFYVSGRHCFRTDQGCIYCHHPSHLSLAMVSERETRVLSCAYAGRASVYLSLWGCLVDPRRLCPLGGPSDSPLCRMSNLGGMSDGEKSLHVADNEGGGVVRSSPRRRRLNENVLLPTANISTVGGGFSLMKRG